MYHSVQTYASKAVCFLVHLSALYSQILQYARITQSRITTSFFVFSLFYCCAQIILQSFILSFDSKYANLLSGIVKGGNLPPANFTFLQGSKGHMHLQICDDIPFGRVYPCTTIYDSTWDLISAQDLYAPQVLHGWENGLTVTSIRSTSSATQVIDVRIETRDSSIVNLSEQCIEILLYPYQLYAHYSHSDSYYSYLLACQITKLRRRRHYLPVSPNMAPGHLFHRCAVRLGTSHVSTTTLIPTRDIPSLYQQAGRSHIAYSSNWMGRVHYLARPNFRSQLSRTYSWSYISLFFGSLLLLLENS
jgi:hypothetical protein